MRDPAGDHSTGEVRLREAEERDLPVFFEHQRDPVASRRAAFPPRHREAFLAHWREKVLADETALALTVLYRGEVAGNVVCFAQSGKRLLGYWLGREFWGKGIATRALTELLDRVRTRPLHAYVSAGNSASIRVLDKCGFEPATREREAATPDESAGRELLFTLAK